MRNILQQLAGTLMGEGGDTYTPPEGPMAGHGIQQWGRDQANQSRFRGAVDYLKNMGRPGAGFLKPQRATPLPNQWEIMGTVMQGRQRAVEDAGGRFKGPKQADYYNEAPSNTRWDDEQVGVDTGNTLGTDMINAQESLNNLRSPSHAAIQNLRRKHGLR